jgi:putative PIN family toxin of toxin-antitoxin system
MRITLDTNVLIAAIISHGVCAELLEDLFENHVIISSAFILKELRDKLSTKFKLDDKVIDRYITLLHKKITIVAPAELSEGACRDKDDDNILGTAIAGGCACIITGDKDLIDMGRYENIEIIRPGDFWAWEQRPR